MANRLTNIIIFSLIVSFFGPFRAKAQTLTFTDCLRRARESSFSLKASERNGQSLKQQFLYERAQSRPQIFADLGVEDHRLSGYGFTQQWALVGTDWHPGNFLYKAFDATQRQMQAARQSASWQKLQVLQRAATLYIRLLQKNRERALLKKQHQLLLLHYNLVRALWQSGAKTELDVLQTRAEILKSEESLNRTAQYGKMLSRELALFLGMAISDSLQLMYLNTAKICALPLPVLSDTLIRDNPWVRSLELTADAQKWRAHAAAAQRLPRLYLAGGYFTDHDPTADGNYWLIRAGMQIPLFSWNATSFEAQSAHIQSQSLTDRALDARRELRIRAQRILIRLKSLKHTLTLQEKHLTTLHQMLQMAKANYQAGLITNLEYLNAQQQWTATGIAKQTTELDYVLALIDFYVLTNQTAKIWALGE